MKPLIPIKISSATTLSEAEQNCLVWYTLSGCKQSEAFKTFVKPELAISPVVLDKVSSQFFSSQSAMSFLSEYKRTLSQALHSDTIPSRKAEVSAEQSAEQRKKNKELAVQKLMDYVIAEAMDFENAENQAAILSFADKLGLLEDSGEHVEAPRRYLPEMCSQCEYKKWIEENCDIVP